MLKERRSSVCWLAPLLLFLGAFTLLYLSTLQEQEIGGTSEESPPTPRSPFADGRHTRKPLLFYYSVHGVLEYDEVRMFTEMGFSVLGRAYCGFDKVDRAFRPYDLLPQNEEDCEKYHNKYAEPIYRQGAVLPEELVKNLDLIVVMSSIELANALLPVANKYKVPIILRSIGQWSWGQEQSVSGLLHKGIKIVRYSEGEKHGRVHGGETATIRFAKYPNDFGPYKKTEDKVLCINQDLKTRFPAAFSAFEHSTANFPRELWGIGNLRGAADFAMGPLPYEAIVSKMKSYRVYFSTGTLKASYTLNFMEALFSGIPVVAVGKSYYKELGAVYEVPDLITNGVNGFVGNNDDELKDFITKLMTDDELHKRVSENGRNRAIELFGVETIRVQWVNFFLAHIDHDRLPCKMTAGCSNRIDAD